MGLTIRDEKDKGRLWWLEDLAVEVIRNDLDASLPKHTHDDWQVARGIYRWWHGNATHTAQPRSVVVVGPGEVHATDAPDGPSWRARSFRIPDSAFQTLADEEGLGVADPEAGLAIVDDPRVASWYALFWRVAAGPASALERTSALNGLVAALVTRGGMRAPEARDIPKAVDRAREFLHADPAREISLAELAEVAGMSPFRLNRTFARAVGLPPHAYQVQLRMRKARSLLLEGVPIAEAACRVGFADQSHMARYFRRFGALPPGEYRRLARKA